MVDLPGPLVVAVLTRAPSHGGKSRLFSALGVPSDAALLSALLLDTLDGAHLAGSTRVVAVEPAGACDEVRAIVPDDVRVFAQSDGSLGDRMRGTMSALFADGASAVVLIGSDLPDITPRTIQDAASRLAARPESIVLGPALDGGYVLIAATVVPDVFDGVEWGSPRVLAQTQSLAASRHLQVELLAPMQDVDTPEDLVAVRAPRTRAWWSSR